MKFGSSSQTASSNTTETSSLPSSVSSKTPVVNDLTGLPIEEKFKNNRPVAVMINNIAQAQPLLGVSQADIIYECPVEGGITRLMAVFKNPADITAIGSVRSARPYFVHIACGLDAIYCHIGGSTEALDLLSTGLINSFDLGNCGNMMWRDEVRRANLGYEHSAMTSGERLEAGFSSAKVRVQYQSGYTGAQKFGETSPVLQGENAQKLTAVFSGYKSTTFTYDQTRKTYLISQFGKPQMDDNIKQQNDKTNVVVLFLNIYSIDDYGRQGIDLKGNGKGYYMSQGKIIKIAWTRESIDTPFVYTTEAGAPLTMLPGQSYVCCMPNDSSVTYE